MHPHHRHARQRRRPQWLVPLCLFAAIITVLVVVSRLTVNDHGIDVEYRVIAADAARPVRANVSWRTPDNTIERVFEVELPWAHAQRMSRFIALDVTGQLYGEGSIRCEVWVNGALYQGFDAQGPGATVSCNAGYESPSKATTGRPVASGVLASSPSVHRARSHSETSPLV